MQNDYGGIILPARVGTAYVTCCQTKYYYIRFGEKMQ